MSDLYLLDKSALARVAGHAAARERFFALDEAGTLATCAVVDLEVGYSARSSAEFDATLADRADLYFDIPVTRLVCARAKWVQRELARRGQHRGPGVADLLIAACAEMNDAVVVHYDHDFDTIAAVTGQRAEWLVPPGTLP